MTDLTRTELGVACALYRIENEGGCGPFIALDAFALSFYHATVVRDPKVVKGQPPYPDHNANLLQDLGLHTGYRWGCTSLQSLRKWFPSPEGLRLLERGGFGLSTYAVEGGAFVPDCDDSVAFDLSRSRRIARTSPMALG